MDYTNSNPSDDLNDFDRTKHLSKTNGFPNANYKASFTPFPNIGFENQASRSVLNVNSSASTYRYNPPSFPSSSHNQITFLGQSNTHAYDSRPYGQINGARKSNLVNQHPGSTSSLHNSARPPTQQQPLYPYSNGVLANASSPSLAVRTSSTSASSQPSSSLHNSAKPPTQQQPLYLCSNGVLATVSSPSLAVCSSSTSTNSQLSIPPRKSEKTKQVPIPPEKLQAAADAPLRNSSSTNLAKGFTTTPIGEEICTIFVVGFPENMQEREFQNMFTFSSGFEAATLKIPNNEPNAVVVNATREAGGFQDGPNDRNNPASNNHGVVINSRRLVFKPAPKQQLLLVEEPKEHFLGARPHGTSGMGLGLGIGPNSNVAPQRQIVGFARFRSCEEALIARDVLQGRRVDIEKGAVLKAELGKKNLHTKRGIWLVPSGSEEICTIFVVGFPEDMQEREFQNMFTFSSGFEAAALKIPNHFEGLELADQLNAAAGRLLGARPHGTGGVRLGLGIGPNANLSPRKQIVGFARFRSPEEALIARDVLQGRRVDIEKGAVLKTEMMRKNPHTKQHPAFSPAGIATTNTGDARLNKDRLEWLSGLDGWRDPILGLLQARLAHSRQFQNQQKGTPTTNKVPLNEVIMSPAITVYSEASSRTMSTDYGVYYTRRAISQESLML